MSYFDDHIDRVSERPKRPKGIQKDRVELALAHLVRWATHGDRDGNPYCKPEVKEAILALGGEDPYDLDPYWIDRIHRKARRKAKA